MALLQDIPSVMNVLADVWDFTEVVTMQGGFYAVGIKIACLHDPRYVLPNEYLKTGLKGHALVFMNREFAEHFVTTVRFKKRACIHLNVIRC